MFKRDNIKEVCPEIDVIESDDGEDFCFVFNSGEFNGVSFVYANLNFTKLPDGALEAEFIPVPLDNRLKAPIDAGKFKEVTGDILIRLVNASSEK